MTAEVLSAAVERASEIREEVITSAKEIAPLGSVKPKEYGSLIKSRLAERAEAEKADMLNQKEVHSNGLSRGFGMEHFFLNEAADGADLNYSSEELAKETADSLADMGITPKAWETADLSQREELLARATEAMGRELKLSQQEAGELSSPAQADYITAMTDRYEEALKLSAAGAELHSTDILMHKTYFEKALRVYKL